MIKWFYIDFNWILNDFEANSNGQVFENYYKEKGEKYFYNFLNDLQDVSNLTQEDFIDWGNKDEYIKEIGIGECAGVVIDLIATLFLEINIIWGLNLSFSFT